MSSALENAVAHLLAERNADGHWSGELSTSALSTATAVVALHTVDGEKHASLIAGGIDWLVAHQNDDGGWGDTVLSKSNISTTLLCWAAINLRDIQSASAEAYVRDYAGSLDHDDIAEAIKDRYGKDRTFSVPILMCCAICGRLGATELENWRRVLPLPFEVSSVPRRWFAALHLPVVSYALPALIAIGYARFFHIPPKFLPLRWFRRWAWRAKANDLLFQIQPPNGGFLEAAPLTSFVTMALASSGEKTNPVVERAVAFLEDSVRPDGSWPIDTNLATWATTLSVKALAAAGCDDFDREKVADWLIDQQYRERHLFTDAPPGGWGWTDLPGGVPDADDTPGALLALRDLTDDPGEFLSAAEAALIWLVNLQNRDGGIPTFCRGWGALPFDRSSPDLTAHTLRAFRAWEPDVSPTVRARVRLGIEKGLRYLKATQNEDGSWTPLWFGNQHRGDETNPTYGTAMVLLALPLFAEADTMRSEAIEWISQNQNPDGGWGAGEETPSTIEETALALHALAENGITSESGREWLIAATNNGTEFPPSPIGFYFAKLWYFERIYPVVWTVSALRA